MGWAGHNYADWMVKMMEGVERWRSAQITKYKSLTVLQLFFQILSLIV